MRLITFKKGRIQEGIKVKPVAGQSFGILLGWKDGSEDRPAQDCLRPVLLSSQNPPEVKEGRIFSTAIQNVVGENNCQTYILTKPINGGPHKKRNNKTLVRINTFYPYFENEQAIPFGGDWTISKGNPKIIASASGGENKQSWTDDLVLMSPGDIICISYHRQGFNSCFLAYEPSDKGSSSVACHDSAFFTKMLNEGRTRMTPKERMAERNERNQRRKSKLLLFAR